MIGTLKAEVSDRYCAAAAYINPSVSTLVLLPAVSKLN